MHLDLLAGTQHRPSPMPNCRPTILLFDSGLGGLTVLSEVERACSGARFVYVADNAAFPYGALSSEALVARVVGVMDRLTARFAPDLVVIACNTASTLVLPHLRRRYPIPFVGTVPAIKPAALLSASRRFSVLATPGTVARDYTRDLIATYAGECVVTLVGSTRLAAMAEAAMAGDPVSDDDVEAEIGPCFVRAPGGEATDVVVLGCTHYPLLLDRFRRLAPWSVTWIDPAAAIAKRVCSLVKSPAGQPATIPIPPVFVCTGEGDISHPLRVALARRGLERITRFHLPLGWEAQESGAA